MFVIPSAPCSPTGLAFCYAIKEILDLCGVHGNGVHSTLLTGLLVLSPFHQSLELCKTAERAWCTAGQMRQLLSGLVKISLLCEAWWEAVYLAVHFLLVPPPPSLHRHPTE